MSTQQDLFTQLQQYAQALNPRLQVATGGNSWLLFQSVSMTAAAIMAKVQAAALQYLLASASSDGLTSLASQYGVIRTAAVAGTAPYVFTMQQAPTQAVTIPAQTVVQTVPQSGQTASQFTTLAAATIPAGQTSSNTVTVQAVQGGSTGNLAIGTLTVIASGPSGVAGSNTAAVGSSGYVLGADAETDAHLRSRTLGAVYPANSPQAIASAALAVPGVFAATVVDAQDKLGDYTCYAAQADGTLPTPLKTSVTSAIALVDGIGLTRTVTNYTLVTQAIAATVTVSSSYTYSAVAAQVSAALSRWVGALLPGQALLPTDLIRACFGAQSGYTAIAGLTDLVVTTPAAPLAATATQIIRISGTPTLTQGTL
jgi:hypothetical protein